MLLLCKRYEHFKEKNVYIKLADRPQCFRRSCFGGFLRVLFASFHFKRRVSKNSPFFIIPVVCTLVDERKCRYVNKALVTIKYHENMTSRDFKIDTLCVMRLKTKCVSFQRPPCIRQCLFVSGFGWFRSEIISMQLASFLFQYCEGLTIHTDIR